MALTAALETVVVIGPVIVSLALSLASELRGVSSLGIPSVSAIGSSSPVQVHRNGLVVIGARGIRRVELSSVLLVTPRLLVGLSVKPSEGWIPSVVKRIPISSWRKVGSKRRLLLR